MGTKDIQLNWGVAVGSNEHLLTVRRKGGWFTDTLTLELDSKQIFTTPVVGSPGNEYRFRVDGREFSLAWKWSNLTGDPEHIVL
jgi:hypothetical protein